MTKIFKPSSTTPLPSGAQVPKKAQSAALPPPSRRSQFDSDAFAKAAPDRGAAMAALNQADQSAQSFLRADKARAEEKQEEFQQAVKSFKEAIASSPDARTAIQVSAVAAWAARAAASRGSSVDAITFGQFAVDAFKRAADLSPDAQAAERVADDAERYSRSAGPSDDAASAQNHKMLDAMFGEAATYAKGKAAQLPVTKYRREGNLGIIGLGAAAGVTIALAASGGILVVAGVAIAGAAAGFLGDATCAHSVAKNEWGAKTSWKEHVLSYIVPGPSPRADTLAWSRRTKAERGW